ncbi:MAG: hypothetical protein QXF12_03210 [Candidatus Aenigmatarchaeota archaeon]
MFSLLNVYTIIPANILIGSQTPILFKKIREMIKSGVPCIKFKKLRFDFTCMNLWFVLYNMSYFFYDNSLNKEEQSKFKDITRNILDYLSYKGDIIRDDFLILNDLTIYNHEYDYDDLFYLVTEEDDYYDKSIYLYFIKNYMLLSGKESSESSEQHNKIVSLEQNSIIREIQNGFLDSIKKIENIKYSNNYRHAKILNNIDKKDYLSLISYILNFLKHYFKELDIIDVKYYGDFSDTNNTSDKALIITCEHNITYFICINKETGDFLANLHVYYTFYETSGDSYYRMPGSPFNMKMVFIKYKDSTKVKLHIAIDKNMNHFKDIEIYFNKNNIDNTKHKYRDREVEGHYHLIIFSEIRNEDVPHISDIINSIKQIRVKIGRKKIHIM